MSLKISAIVSAALAAILLSACSTTPQTTPTVGTELKKEPAKAAEAVLARAAYFELYKAARAWAPDLLALTIKSGEVPGYKNEGGKAGLWVVVFVSPSRREARTFSHAVANSGTEYREGINVSDKQTWGGATPTAKAFANGEFIVDSDAAYKVAEEKAAGWLKTHPKAQATFLLGNTSRFPAPVWYILWGTQKDGYAVYVNATTGKVVTY